MRAYELMLVVNPGADADTLRGVLSQVTDIVSGAGGEVTFSGQLSDKKGNVAAVEDDDGWKTRRLAYVVDGHKEAYYAVVRFSAPPTSIDEVERVLNIRDDVLRHLVVRQDEVQEVELPEVPDAPETPAAAAAAAAPETAVEPDEAEATDEADEAEEPDAADAAEAPDAADAAEAPDDADEAEAPDAADEAAAPDDADEAEAPDEAEGADVAEPGEAETPEDAEAPPAPEEAPEGS